MNITSGWRRAAVFTETEKAFIPKIAADPTALEEEIISSETTDGSQYGGKIYEIVIGLFEQGVRAQLEEWMKDSTPVSIAIASTGFNVLTQQITSEPIRFRRAGGTNARDGLSVDVLEATMFSVSEDLYEVKNLALIPGTTTPGAATIPLTFPVSGITFGVGASFGVSGNLTFTIKDIAGVTLATDTVASVSGRAELTLASPPGAYSVEITVDAAATDITLRTDADPSFINI